MELHTQSGDHTVRIHEIHMEEDAGKLVHDPWIDQTRADYNRCGVPLIEIVTGAGLSHRRPGDRLPGKAEGDAAISGRIRLQDAGGFPPVRREPVRPAHGQHRDGHPHRDEEPQLLQAIARAIDYEAKRQIELLEEGKQVVQETRRWDENKDATYAMRSKEDAQDYRYFPEPDIPPIELSEEYLDELRASQPELAEAKRERYQADYGLPAYDCQMITSDKVLADFFEALVSLGTPPKQGANWIMGEVLGRPVRQGAGAQGHEADRPHPGPAHRPGGETASSTGTPPSRCSRPSLTTTGTWTSM